MMICNADFEELFPETFRSKRQPALRATVTSPSAACLARWEDDGGRVPASSVSGQAPGMGMARARYRMPSPTRTGLAVATMPVAAAYGAAWTMLATYDQLMKI